MKLRLLEFIRCPLCKSSLKLLEETVSHAGDGQEVMSGFLQCPGCGYRYLLEGGVPRLLASISTPVSQEKARTASSYGYLWARPVFSKEPKEFGPYHFDRMERSLSLIPSGGLMLDAGCGAGIDLANQAQRPGVEIIGIELSPGGCRSSFKRSVLLPNAHVVQGDLCRLPFDDNYFDFIYSYGVLHHLSSPREGLGELVRVLKPKARIGVYLYEDLATHAWGWRWLLKAANQFRWMSCRLPHRLLYFLCWLASPIVYLLFTLPFWILHRIPGVKTLAAHFPFRHASGPFSLAGDLYDRFSAPVEWRYSQAQAIDLLQGAGLKEIQAVRDRGWMISGAKP